MQPSNLKTSEHITNAGHQCVLVVDDDRRIRELLERFLGSENYTVMSAENAGTARELLKRFSFDALIVDVMMPGESGLEFTRAVRGSELGQSPPVLLLTALGETENRIAGLESGADDYLPKPFEPRELILRLSAILRRSGSRHDPAGSRKNTVVIGPWHYDAKSRRLLQDHDQRYLSESDAALLDILAASQGKTVRRTEICAQLDIPEDSRALDIQITRLRRKLGDDARHPQWLQTVRGEGYALHIENED